MGVIKKARRGEYIDYSPLFRGEFVVCGICKKGVLKPNNPDIPANES